jgi:hypothetical protein
MNSLIKILAKSGLLTKDLDYHLVRASMVIIFFFFGYQKWFPYEFGRLVPFISNGPLIWWLYPVFGHAGASYFLVSRSGRSGPCYSRASGTSGSAFLVPSARPPPSSRRSPSFLSCRRAGTWPREDSQP